ncbi:MAG TPA: glycosyltransferase family 2 protein [Thermoanaerobaculia bacterium]
MSAPLVTTIVPVYNRPAMLREALDSVLAQTHRPVEVIVVDDGSTDDTGAVADALAREHDGIVRVVHIANGGPGAAREAGRQLARGEFIQHLDSDDLLLPRKFELQLAALRDAPECGAAYGWTRLRHADGRVEPAPWKRSGEQLATMFPAMLASRWWDTPNPLYRASVIAAAGPWTPLRIEEDWEYDCRIAAQGVRLAYVPDWVCEVRRHDAHTSGHATAAAFRDRTRAHLLMLEHARGIANDTPEKQFFARDLFHLARQCGAFGLTSEARALIEAAESISPARDIRIYAVLARLFGWRVLGRISS